MGLDLVGVGTAIVIVGDAARADDAAGMGIADVELICQNGFGRSGHA